MADLFGIPYHAGSWFGLPDFGLTEGASYALNGSNPVNYANNLTAQGGSNLFGPSSANNGSSVLGITSQVNPQSNLNNYSIGANNTTANTGVRTAAPQQNTGPVQGPQQPSDPYAQMRSDINGAWDNYIGGLNGSFDSLNSSASNQNQIINSQYDQGVNQISTQKAKSLRDISENMRNAFTAGNNYLGARGASDSSATGQYSFALNKEAAKQTSQLNEFVNTQMGNLSSQKDQQMLGVAQWLSQAQQAVRDQINTGQLNKSKDIQQLNTNILNQALQAKQQLEQQAQVRYNALLSWAASNSKTFGDLTNNINSIPQPFGQPTVDSSGNYRVPVGYGYGSSNDQTKNPFQNLFQ